MNAWVTQKDLPTQSQATVMPEQPKSKRRWFQYSLRTLFVLVAIVGVIIMATVVMPAVRQRRAVEKIEELGGNVHYDYELRPDGTYDPDEHATAPAWLRRAIGEDYFANVVGVDLLQKGDEGDAAMEVVSSFPKLRRLLVSTAGVTQAGLARLTRATNLETLGLFSSPIDDAGLAQIGRLSRLRELHIYMNEGTTASLQDLERLPGLQVLSLAARGNHLAYFTGLGSLSGLTELNVSNIDITDDDLEAIGKLTKLERLDLNGARISDAGLAKLRFLQGLQYLDLSSGDALISDAAMQYLKPLTTLTDLRLRYNTGITDAGIRQLVSLTKLKNLDISWTHITASGYRKLKAALPNAEIISSLPTLEQH